MVGILVFPRAQQLSDLLNKGLVGKSSIMIGDRNVDLISAKANDLSSVGVLWGYGDYEELSQENPTFILDSPEQLMEIITLTNIQCRAPTVPRMQVLCFNNN